MDFIQNLKWRYATKRFDSSKKVPSEIVDKIIDSARLCATSLGLQQFRLLVIEDQEIKSKMTEICYGQPQAETCSHALVLACRNDLDGAYIDEHAARVAATRGLNEEEQASTAKRIKGWVDAMEADHKKVWEEKQAYIGLGHLLFAAALEKVDACPMEGFQRDKLDELLGLEEKNLRSVVLCPIGYRDPEDEYQTKKKVRLDKEQFSIVI